MLSTLKPFNILKNKSKSIPSTKSIEEPPEIFHNLVKHQDMLIETLKYSEGYCQVDKGVNLFYQLYGNGPKKVLFVNGLNCTHHIWLHQAQYFALMPEYQVCIFDNRGIGGSDKPLSKYSISKFVKDAAKLLDHLGWATGTHLIGMSMGGMIAQRLCLDYPARFETLTLTSTYHSAIAALPTAKDVKFALQMLTKPFDQWVQPLINTTFPKCWRNQTHEDSMLRGDYLKYLMMQWFSQMPQQTNTTLYLQAIAAVNHNLLPYQLKKIQRHGIRCLVIHGDRDRVIRLRCGKELAKLLNCNVVEIKNGGHVLMVQDPENYSALLHAHFEESRLDSYLKYPLERKQSSHFILKDQEVTQSDALKSSRKPFGAKRSKSLFLPQWIAHKEDQDDETPRAKAKKWKTISLPITRKKITT